MPRNPTTGVFTRVANSFSNPVFGTLIDPTDADALFDDQDVGLNPPVLAGPLSITGKFGYATGAGAGGAVTQITSRTTGVTLDKATGAITLFSAAGTGASATTFTVTNSTVAATDVIVVNQKSGTDKYVFYITRVAAGAFDISFYDQSGTTVEQPVVNFAVIKGAAT